MTSSDSTVGTVQDGKYKDVKNCNFLFSTRDTPPSRPLSTSQLNACYYYALLPKALVRQMLARVFCRRRGR